MKKRAFPARLFLSCLLLAFFAAAAASGESPTKGVDGDWLSSVQEQISEQEYHVTWQDGTFLPDVDAAWHAPNRAHGFRTYFTEDGIRVVPRTEESPSWHWGLELVGYGRGERAWAVDGASLRPSVNRIDYDRGNLVEWYANAPEGLKQGFTLYGPPGGTGTAHLDVTAPSGPVSARLDTNERLRVAFVELALDGTLEPTFSTDGRAIDFHTAGGVNVVHFAELLVTDAGGRELPAWMEGFSGNGRRGVRIVFDDTDAAYPVTIDPLATSPAWTAEGNQVSAFFGLSVSAAGDVNGDGYADVIVGAYAFDNGQANEGRAFVYLGSATGLATIAAWTAESNQVEARLGISVSTAGDVNGDGFADVIVGAHQFDNGEVDEGRAFVYHGSASGLAPTPAWTAEGNQSSANFGYSVSTAGDVDGDGYTDVIVGAYRHDNGEVDEGRAFVYHGTPAGLKTVEDWSAESNQASANLGYSVSTAGDVNGDGYADVIVGAYRQDNGQTNEGRAIVYHGSAAGLSSTPAWTAEPNQASAFFGLSVSTAGDVNGDGYADVIVGAYRYDGGQTDEGRAFVYHGSTTGLAVTPARSIEANQVSAGFGYSVSTAGDVNGDGYADVIVGAYDYDNGQTDEGRAFVYFGSPTGVSAVEDWSAESNQTSANHGISVSTAGDVNGDGYADVIVGAYLYDNGQTDEGRAFVYHGSAAGPAATAGWTAEANQASAHYGTSVSTAGDVNGDGYADVIVGAQLYDNGQTDEGRAFVYHGSTTGLATTAAWTAESNQASAAFGNAVSTAGDVNGDGYADVVVGAAAYGNGQAYEGRAFVYHGSPTGLASTAAWTAESDQASASFGGSVSTAGDVNGDGHADVIVGAQNYDNGQTDEGRAFVYHGSTTGLATTAAWTAESDQANAQFGTSVSTAGDVDGDGYADVIVGAPLFDNGEPGEGRAFVYHGSAGGLSAVERWTAESDQVSAWFGESVSTAGDVNGDGYADVIVGAYDYDNGQSAEGAAFVYLGSAAGLSAVDSWSAESDQAGAWFGESVSAAGDVNGDGYADVVVGARFFDNGQTDEGRAFVYHGSATGLATAAAWTAESDQATAWFGISVGAAGDVNGDGYADVIVGAPLFDNGQANEGRAFVFYGNSGAGLSLRPRQLRADNTAPIAVGGRSRESGSLRLAALGRTPFGRGRVQLEWEVKPLGQPFDGAGTGRSPWSDTGTTGADINQLVSGLEPGAQHWRLRLIYDPATSPYAGASRWFTVPWNGWGERDLTLSPFVGGKVWEDRDGDGILAGDEPLLGGVLVHLINDAGAALQTTVTSSDGTYRFELMSGGTPAVRFVAPQDWAFTLQNQGQDDMVDSDADTVTGETAPLVPPFDSMDEERWSAGLRRVGPCFSPDEPIYIYGVRLSTDGNDYPILDFQDPNQPSAVTGYNVYRSSDAGLPPATWPQVASDVVDMDQSMPNYQWVDTTGDVSPSGTWYYEVAPYNSACDAEGPR